MTKIPKIIFIEMGVSYEIYPPSTGPILSPSPASIELTTDFDIPESVGEKYKDDREGLLRWTVENIVIPGLTDCLENPDYKFDEDE